MELFQRKLINNLKGTRRKERERKGQSSHGHVIGELASRHLSSALEALFRSLKCKKLYSNCLLAEVIPLKVPLKKYKRKKAVREVSTEFNSLI